MEEVWSGMFRFSLLLGSNLGFTQLTAFEVAKVLQNEHTDIACTKVLREMRETESGDDAPHDGPPTVCLYCTVTRLGQRVPLTQLLLPMHHVTPDVAEAPGCKHE